MRDAAIQDQIVGNFCWGCGADNPDGLHLKSYWGGAVANATFFPPATFAAGPRHVLNGGIIAMLLDCHGVCTAIAHSYDDEERAIGSEPEIWCATSSMTIEYLRPTPIGQPVALTGRVLAVEDRSVSVECILACADKDRARATIRAVRVPDSWRHAELTSSQPPRSERLTEPNTR